MSGWQQLAVWTWGIFCATLTAFRAYGYWEKRDKLMHEEEADRG